MKKMSLETLIGWLMACVCTAAPQTSNHPSFEMVIRPVRNGGAEVTSVRVRWRLDNLSLKIGEPFRIAAPITYAGRTGIADRVDSLTIRDVSGVVPYSVENDSVNPAGFPYYRHWRADRPVDPPVVVTYQMRSFAGVPRPGPQFDFFSHGGGISTGGMALFVLAEDTAAMSMHVKWDLTDLSPGSIAASTYGEGDLEREGTLDDLTQAFYMAGPLGSYAPPPPTSGFRAYWLGQPTFDPQKEMSWTYQAFEYLRKFYRDSTVSSYSVFVRSLPGTGGGTALKNSFMLGNSARYDSSGNSTRQTLAHEMGHMWVGELAGAGTEGTPWFEEGLNEYYTHLLLLRSGLAPISDYERDINKTVRAYFTNPFRNASADSLKHLGFSTGVGAGTAQNVPYVRGNLYFAEVDAMIRKTSGGRRTLDDVILPLFERRRRGESVTQETLIDAFVKEIGPSAREHFEAMVIRGETIVPDPDAFGPCFDRHPAKFEVKGKEIDGFEWVRVPSVPESRCRKW